MPSSSIDTVSKNGSGWTRCPRSTAPAASRRAWPCTVRAMRSSPSAPWYTAYIEASTAGSTWAVQMFEVAFSRRMCCSRVCSESRYGDPSTRVARHPDHPPRQAPLELVAGGDVGGVRSAEAHRHAEALGRADGDVRPHLTRRPQQNERQRVGRHHRERSGAVHALDQRLVVVDRAGGGRVLEQHAEHRAVGLEGAMVAGHHLDAERPGARLHHLERLRMAAVVDEEPRAGAARRGQADRHRLGGRGPLVEQRRVGHRQTGEVGDHGLEVDERLEAALRDLGLVRRVGGVPGGVLQHVALDHPRHHARVVAHAQARAQHHVPARDHAQLFERFVLAHTFADRDLAAHPDRGGNGLLHQRVQRREAEHLEHLLDLLRAGADVAFDEVGQAGGGCGPRVRLEGWVRHCR